MVPFSLLAAKKGVLSFEIFFDGVPDDPGNGYLFFFRNAFQLRIEIGREGN